MFKGRYRAAIAEEVERRLEQISDLPPMKIAVMGCEVNGPGEARYADVGIAGAENSGVIFAEGRALRKVSMDRIVEELLHEVERLAGARQEPQP